MDVASQQKILVTCVVVQVLSKWLLHILSLAIFNICNFILKEPTTFNLVCYVS